LFVLLTGCHPFQFDNRSPDAIARVICDTEPPKPSTAVRRTNKAASGTGAQQATAKRLMTSPVDSPEKISKRLRGDLDNIVLMALRKDPLRRYASAEQFAEDVRRYLENLPVMARKDTTRYRVSKFVMRHKAGSAAATATLVLLLAALFVTVHEARVARLQAQIANQQAQIAREQRARAEKRTARAGLAGAAYSHGIYAIGGYFTKYLTDLLVYNGSGWTKLRPMPSPRAYLAAATVNSNIYAIGGYDGHSVLDTVEVYSAQTGKWTAAAPMPTARRDLAAVVLNNKIYAIGGSDGQSTLSLVEVYDPSTNSWSTAPSPLAARTQFGAVTVNGFIYLMGGAAGTSILGTVEQYSPPQTLYTFTKN